MARARNARGQFIKRGRSGGSTALARRGPSGLSVRRVYVPVPKLKRRGASSAGGGRTQQKDAAIGGAILGYVKSKHSAETYDKIPDVKGSKNAAIALGGYVLQPKNPWLKRIALAASAIGAYEVTQGMSGDDDDAGGAARW